MGAISELPVSLAPALAARHEQARRGGDTALEVRLALHERKPEVRSVLVLKLLRRRKDVRRFEIVAESCRDSRLAETYGCLQHDELLGGHRLVHLLEDLPLEPSHRPVGEAVCRVGLLRSFHVAASPTDRRAGPGRLPARAAFGTEVPLATRLIS